MNTCIHPFSALPSGWRVERYAYVSTFGWDLFVQACIAFCALGREKGLLAAARAAAVARRWLQSLA
jgi:hypothetical protein